MEHEEREAARRMLSEQGMSRVCGPSGCELRRRAHLSEGISCQERDVDEKADAGPGLVEFGRIER